MISSVAMKSLSAGLLNESARHPEFLELRKVLFDKQFTPNFDPVITTVPVSEFAPDRDEIWRSDFDALMSNQER